MAPSASSTPSASPVAHSSNDPVTPEPTPVAPPPDDPPPFAAIERDGVRLTLQLERNPMPSGEETWVRTVLTNDSNRVLHWGSGGCEVPVWVRGTMPNARWRPGERPASNQLDLFKHLALDGITADQPEFMGFMPESVEKWGLEVEDFGCGDSFVGHDLPAGASLVERHRWDGTVMFAHSPMSAGRLELHATFDMWWRGADTPEHRGQPLVLPLDAWVTGVADPPRLDPAEAIDAAVADPVFGPWLEARGDLRNAKRPFVRYDAARHLWRVGLKTYNPTRTRVCNVDADTGEVVSITGSAE